MSFKLSTKEKIERLKFNNCVVSLYVCFKQCRLKQAKENNANNSRA
jgi:hypothetical protein